MPISNMEKPVSFYQDVIGLKKVHEHLVWTSFDIEAVSFEIAIGGTTGPVKSSLMNDLATLWLSKANISRLLGILRITN